MKLWKVYLVQPILNLRKIIPDWQYLYIVYYTAKGGTSCIIHYLEDCWDEFRASVDDILRIHC